MPEIDQRRLARLLGMMGSQHDGEVLNAARMAHRLVEAAGLTWEQVVDGGGYNEDFVAQVARAAYEKGKEDGKPQPPSETFSGYARHVLEMDYDRLSDWEIGFLTSWQYKGENTPTPKQYAVFVRLSRRIGVPLPVELREVGE